MTVCRCAVLWGLTFLIIIPYATIAAGAESSLRKEAVTYRTQGYEAQQRGDLAEALSSYQKAAVLDPAYPTPHNDMGILLEREGRLEEAEAAYQRALRLGPDYPEPHANLAMLYERTGQMEKSAYHWKQRYAMGDVNDPGTRRAGERLFQLGILDTASASGLAASLHRIADQEFQAHAESLERFHAVTDARSDRP